ncbi:MAG: UDP-glucose 4-epimerase GalE [Deltaproteobacteria bacterium]|nr:UDP-glucose 4-epimerase GalE [Deltaproteobacteria bacterium]
MAAASLLEEASVQGRRVLVVGGAGYIGSHCALLLQEAGAEITVYDDLSTGYAEAVTGRLVRGDVRDRARLETVLQEGRFDAVMHFAARLLVGESVAHPLAYFDTNVAGTCALLSAMAAADVRTLVFSSSCAIYGEPRTLPLDEAHPFAPVSPYGLTKLMVEQVLDACREREGFRIASLRYFNAAGAHPGGRLGEAHDPETHLVPLALEAAAGWRRIRLFGRDYPTPDGTCIRDYVHVWDLAEAHRLALEALWAGQAGRAWNVGTGTGSSVLEVIAAVERVTGRSVQRDDAPRRPGDPPALYAKADAIRQDLGWIPRHPDLEVTVEHAWRWLQAPRYGRYPRRP